MESWLCNYGKRVLKIVKSKTYDRIAVCRVKSKDVNSAEVGDCHTYNTENPTVSFSEGFTLTPHCFYYSICLSERNEKGWEGKRKVRKVQ
jgi:hypothetical protein